MNSKIFYYMIPLLLISTGTVFAEESLLTIQTNEKNYDEGDTIVISGNVRTIIGETPIIIQIIHQGTIVHVAQITLAQDGNFVDTIQAKGNLWKNDGEYIIKAAYGNVGVVDLKFNYFSKSASVETLDNFEVDAGSYGTFDVPYSITGGTVKNIIINSDNLGIDIEIESSDKGRIVLNLPREFIDAEKQNGKDESYIILIDGIETIHNESIIHADYRTITIDFEGDTKIEIIGTYVIPEFGAVVIMMIIGILTVIIISKNKLQIKI